MNNIDQIRYMKLNNGDDIIAQIVEKNNNEGDDNYVLVFNAYRILYLMHEETDQMAINLMPWIFPNISKDPGFKIYTTDILTSAEPSTVLLKYYKKSIGLSNKPLHEPEVYNKLKSLSLLDNKEDEQVKAWTNSMIERARNLSNLEKTVKSSSKRKAIKITSKKKNRTISK